MPVPLDLTRSLRELLVDCAEGAHVWEMPESVGQDERWVGELLSGLVHAGFAELDLLEPAVPGDAAWTSVPNEDVRTALARDEAWKPGTMSDGKLLIAHITAAGMDLLRAISHDSDRAE